MPPENQTIEFEGYFAEGILGIFKIIRGFADLRDPAVISVSYELNEGGKQGHPFYLADIEPFICPGN